MNNKKKPVPSTVYTKEYYLNDCTGFNEFKESYGEKLEPRLNEIVKYFKVNPGDRVLDIGCGRGELMFYAAKQGAECTGIDYSTEAISLAKLARSKKEKALRQRIKFSVMDAKQMKFDNSAFDIVILTDFVEHLHEYELRVVFKHIKKILKKDGLLVVHTAPNKIFNDFAYRYYCYPVSSFLVFVWNLISGKKYPNIARYSELRTDSHAIMHVNEPTYLALKKLFKENGFEGCIQSSNVTARKAIYGMKDYIYNLFVFLDPFSRLPPLNVLFGSDFVAVLKNKK